MEFPKILDAPDMELFLKELKLAGGFNVVESYNGTDRPEAWVVWRPNEDEPEVIYTRASMGCWVRNPEGMHSWLEALTHAEEYAEEYVACNGR